MVVFAWVVAAAVVLFYWIQRSYIAALLLSAPVVAVGFSVYLPLALVALVIIWTPIAWGFYFSAN